jgi:hypothetical protein
MDQNQSKTTKSKFSLWTNRWTRLRHHVVQEQLIKFFKRFNVNPAGRRSGKTEIAKRKLVRMASIGTRFDDPRFFAAAPTRDQAKRIYWSDLKQLTPAWMMAKTPNESELIIYYKNGSMIQVLGMDKPERIEGAPWDGGILDEFGNMKKQTWAEHVRPALADRRGWCDLIGVPEGRNHYYDLALKAQAELAEKGDASEWGYYHWISADILPPEEIAAMKADMDELTYLQEAEASFVNFQGRTYYAFTDQNKAKITYDKKQPIGFCMDFNVAPGVAVIVQEKTIRDLETNVQLIGETATGIIGEVYIPRNSNTPLICNKLIADWGRHEGLVYIYGDSTGGAKKTSSIGGSDWDLVKKILGAHFGDRLHYKVPNANPSERDRVNSVNSRCRTMQGKIRLFVDPYKARMTAKDFEGVQCVEGGSGEIDKKKNPELTHLTDAIGYYVHKEFPIRIISSRMATVKTGGTF